MSTETKVAAMSEAQLAEIEGRADAASRGPWRVKSHEFSGGRVHRIVMGKFGCLWNDWDGLNDEADGVFIAAARADVPALVAEVRRLNALLVAAGVSGDTEDQT